ncbi:MAG TPA: aminoacetone oxidase family FAD-binding enzyme [Vicinamibacterales bacterium]
MIKPRVVVIGAGAAGTMAAIFSASTGAETLLLERTKDGGRKILISGGGRCNILPAEVDESRFVSDSPPHLVRKILRAWPLRDQIDFFQREAGIPLVEEPDTAKLFPASQRARDVRDRLIALAHQRGVTVVMNAWVRGMTRPNIDRPQAGWHIQLHRAEQVRADAVVVATGGLSVPQTGSDGGGLRMVEALGHDVRPTYAALTPLVADQAPFAALAGVSVPVTITASAETISATATGGFLFTHRGYSGPAVLDVSHVAVRSRTESTVPARIKVRWTKRNEREWESVFRAGGNRSIARVLSREIPQRLADALLAAAAVEPRRTLSNLSRQERHRVIEILVRGDLPWTGDEGYKKAEVTGGGVRLSEIDPKTMESRRHKRLFLCGEMLDAFGPIGGHNFLWAWATGRAAGLAAAASIA